LTSLSDRSGRNDDRIPVYINGRFLSQGVTGVQRHATEVVRALDRLLTRGPYAPAPPWSLLVPPNAREFAGLGSIVVRRVGRLRGHLWEQLELPRFARAGLLLNFANAAPLSQRRQIVTIHDASVFAVPDAYTPAFRLWYRFLLPRIGKRSKLVLTDSEFSRSELADRAGIPLARQRVVHLGCDHILSAPADEAIFTLHGIGDRPFILAVGSPSPHKNIAMAAGAITQLSSLNCVLVVAGGANPAIFKDAELRRLDRVRWLGFVSDAALRALYERAVCFVYPSLYEGFGLPPLEAMACGCPTLVARAASLPEVCGDASLYFDPLDPADLARAIEQVVSSEALRNDLRARGLERARGFLWDSTARTTLDSVLETLQGT